MSDKDKIKDVKECFDKTATDLDGLMTQMEEDFQMYLGDQWEQADKERLEKEKRPILSINKIKKGIDVITGYQMQNRNEIKVRPIEGSDQALADVYTEVIKWVLTDGDSGFSQSQAFKNACIGGLGWLHPQLVYDDDIVNGDLIVTSESPFRMYFDPDLTHPGLRDCKYLIRHAWVDKDALKMDYPEYKKDIDAMKAGNENAFKIQQPRSTTKNRMSVIEKWYREYEFKHFIHDATTNQITEWTKDMESIGKIKKLIEEYPDEMVPETETTYGQLTVIKRKLPVIKYIMVLENKLILSEGLSPYKSRQYPFIPVWGWFAPGFNDWEWKVQGIVRVLKDSQREVNKSRSAIMHAVMSMPLSGYWFEEGAVKDPADLKSAGGGVKTIAVKPGKKVNELPPPTLPTSVAQIEQQHNLDMREMGPNPDLLGMIGGGTGASAPGITLQLRQKQGIMSNQDVFESLSYANRRFGKFVIDIVNNHYSAEKISRIINRELPPQWEEAKENSRYDCMVDEVANSPTYRVMNFMVLTELAKQGLPVPMTTLVEATDLPMNTKQEIIQYIQQQQQMAAQQQGAPPGPPQGPPQ